MNLQLSPNLRTRVELMKDFHGDQFDSQGCPYWLHPYRVALESLFFARTLFDFTAEDRNRIFTVALFHDVIEDTDVPIEYLMSAMGHDEKSLRAILFLTKPKVIRDRGLLNRNCVSTFTYELLSKFVDEQLVDFKYDQWVQGIIDESFSLVAPLVKYCDNRDNSLAWRSKQLFVPNTKYDSSKKMLSDYLKQYAYEEVRDTGAFL